MFRQLLKNQKKLNNVAFYEGEKAVSFFELQQRANCLSVVLPIEQQNIAVFLPNGSDFVASLWGIVQKGLTALPLNVQLTANEILPILKKASVKTVVTNSSLKNIVGGFLSQVENIVCVDELECNDCKQYTKIIDKKAPALLLTTSGTTGVSKLVPLTEQNIETSYLGYSDKMNLTFEQDFRYVLAVPFCSAYGIMILSTCLHFGYSIILMPEPFLLNGFFRLVEKHKATHYEGSATPVLLMEQLLGKEISFDSSSLKFFGFGGSKVSKKTVEKVSKAYPNFGFFEGYGMTEASPLIAKFRCDKPVKFGSVGSALKNVKIAVDVDGQIVTKPNTMGEIVASGKNVMKGYYLDQAETNLALKNGYLYTGDIGYIDDEGFLFISGRKKSQISSRGFKIFPEEVEECLLNSGLVLDCVVYSELDMFDNEIVVADVVAKKSDVDEAAIRKYCRGKLAEFKQPQKINFVEEIAKKPSGKIQRKSAVDTNSNK